MQPYIRNRAYGTETEYGTIFQVSPGIFERCLPNGNLIDILDRKRKEGIFVRPRLWLKNGGCVYIDTGDHPEYASPECVSPKEAARYSKAGDKVVSGIFSSSQDSERRMILVKNNLASALNASDADPLVSFGFHENIQIFDMAPSDGHVRRATIPFLVSRQIIEGAGCFLPSGEYSYTQRGHMMEEAQGNHTTATRAMVTAHRESHMNSSTQSARLHIIVGDSNMLEYQVWLKLAITGIVVAMVENHQAIDYGYSSESLQQRRGTSRKQIACEMARVSRDFSNRGQTPLITLGDDSVISAYDLQVRYLEAAERFVRRASFETEACECETKEALEAWRAALNALYHNDTEWMLGRFDYMTKYVLFGEYLKRKGKGGLPAEEIRKEEHSFDLIYHCLPAINARGPTFFERVQKYYVDQRLFDETRVSQATEEPPCDTRAFMRSRCVYALLDLEQQGRLKREGMTLEWDSLYYQGNRFEIYDPQMCKKDGFDSFLRKIEVS